MASPVTAIYTIGLTTDAGVSRNIKMGASPLEINDVNKVALAGEAVSAHPIRTKNRVSKVAGVLKPKIDKNFSVANRN